MQSHIANAVEHGASVVCGGRRSELAGFFFEPTVLTNVTKDMVIAQANDTEFDLAA